MKDEDSMTEKENEMRGWRVRARPGGDGWRSRSVAPPALEILRTSAPALTRWSKFCRAYGAMRG